MILSQVGIRNFRVVNELLLNPHPGLNLIQGNNGSGKSSVLEAIQCLAVGHSFRTRQARELIAFEADSFSVNATFIDPSTQQEHRAGLKKDRNSSTTLRLDYDDVKTQSQIAQLLPVKVLTPDSHFLIQQGPEERRSFMDWGLFHVKQDFLQQWKIFRRSLSQRNQLLKTSPHLSDIRAWDKSLASSGTLLTTYRDNYIRKLEETVQRRLTAMRVTFHVELGYKPGWDVAESLENILKSNIDIHRRMRTTTDGPHRADMIVKCDGNKARHVLSRGQQKTLVYALHLSQLDLLTETASKKSIVLCDDLISELDQDNVKALIAQILDSGNQTFVTGTDLSQLIDNSHHMFHMEHGICQISL